MPVETEFQVREKWHGGVYARSVERHAAELAEDASPEAREIGARLLACMRCDHPAACGSCPLRTLAGFLPYSPA